MSGIVSSHRVVIDGIHTHYITAGQGTPLVLLHGTAIDSGDLSFGPSLDALAEHYRVIALDWPGYGRSEPPRNALGIADYVDFLHSFIDALELERCHLAGFSMGGAVAVGFALEHPARVRKLILIASYGLGSSLRLPLLPYLALKVPFGELPVWRGLRSSRTLLRWFLKLFVFGNPRAVTDELVGELHRRLRMPDTERAFMHWLRGELRPYRFATSYKARLKDLLPPTLLLHGARDLIVPASRARTAAELIPNARLRIIPGCGHWLPREAARAFREEVLSFLDADGEGGRAPPDDVTLAGGGSHSQ